MIFYNYIRIIILTFFFSTYIFAENNVSSGDKAAYQKGLQFYTEKKYLLAIGNFKKAVESGYQDPNLLLYLGNCYVATEDSDKALEQYKLALEVSDTPSFQAVVSFDIGYTYYIKKEFEKSIDYFNKAYTLNNSYIQTYWLKGNAYYMIHDKQNTIQEWEKYISLAPDGRENGNIRKALEILKMPKFDFAKDTVTLPGRNKVSTNTAAEAASEGKEIKDNVDVAPLIDIEGVLDDVKPVDKGKVTDEGMEDIEK